MQGVVSKLSPIVAGQLTLAIAALLLVAFTPPVQGRMLLIPLDGQPIPEATVRGWQALPLKPGPLQGSWVIEGERRSLAGLLFSKGIVVFAAPAAICVSSVASEELPT